MCVLEKYEYYSGTFVNSTESVVENMTLRNIAYLELEKMTTVLL